MALRPWHLIALTLAVPTSAFAAASAYLSEGDLDAWVKTAADLSEEADARGKDIRFQGSNDLFPQTGTGTEATEGEFLSVKVDGRVLVFSDVPTREWFAPYVRSIAELGIISGYRDASGVPLGKFGPGDSVTLEQVLKVVAYASGKDPSSCKGTGTGGLLNPNASDWAKPFVLCAEEYQWSVFSDGTVDTKRGATRAEVIATVLQAFGVQTGNVSGDVFKDVGSATLYASAIERAQKDGIVNGYTDAQGNATGLFGPDDTVKRAEFAKMVTIALEVYGK